MLCTTRACKILFYFKLLVITCIVVAVCFQAFLPSHISTGLFESSTLVYVQYIHVLCTVPYNMIHIRVVQKNEVKLFQGAFASFCSFWRKNYFCKISCDLRKFYHCHKAIVYSIHAQSWTITHYGNQYEKHWLDSSQLYSFISLLIYAVMQPKDHAGERTSLHQNWLQVSWKSPLLNFDASLWTTLIHISHYYFLTFRNTIIHIIIMLKISSATLYAL